jgi:hypothetical protein
MAGLVPGNTFIFTDSLGNAERSGDVWMISIVFDPLFSGFLPPRFFIDSFSIAKG